MSSWYDSWADRYEDLSPAVGPEEPGIGAPQQSWEVDILNAGSSAANAYAYAVCMG